MHYSDFQNRPIRTLVGLFLCWKLVLVLVASCSPGPGYDTSANLAESSFRKELPVILRHLVNKLLRWDAVYYVKVAERNYLYEQEWAFGWGFTRAIAFGTQCLKILGVHPYEGLEAWVGISISHIAHLLSVLFMYYISTAIFPRSPPAFACIAASLQVISPAGIFLSAPQAESSCAALSFAGCLLFVKSRRNNHELSLAKDVCLITSGVMFGMATTVRSNGILNGLLLLEEAFGSLLKLYQEPSVARFFRLLAAGIGGMCVGVGFLLPQYIAYTTFCGHTNISQRVWCQETLPSIYSFVQSHYWNVGPLRYWTISNLPLFLLATPMLTILFVSGVWGIKNMPVPALKTEDGLGAQSSTGVLGIPIIQTMAVAQLLLATTTLTTAHVQIITRISSAYPVWIWYLAASLQEGKHGGFVKFMVLYSIIQASLYASFLPPA